MTTVSVRYITEDVDAALDFYVERLGFDVDMRPEPGLAILSRHDLRLLLNRPDAGGAGQPMPDGRRPPARRLESHPDRGPTRRRRGRAAARGWGHLPERHRHWAGRQQALLEDPSGNPSELFQPAGA